MNGITVPFVYALPQQPCIGRERQPAASARASFRRCYRHHASYAGAKTTEHVHGRSQYNGCLYIKIKRNLLPCAYSTVEDLCRFFHLTRLKFSHTDVAEWTQASRFEQRGHISVIYRCIRPITEVGDLIAYDSQPAARIVRIQLYASLELGHCTLWIKKCISMGVWGV